MRFKKILLLGGNKIACDCTKYLNTLLEDSHSKNTATKIHNTTLSVLETAISPSSMLRTLCQKLNLPYLCLTSRFDIENFILDFTQDRAKTLIISANNRFIFTPKIIDKPYIEIINFHYALLPHYRGMNIPTWVIFNDEKKTGITWHFVTKDIDKGAIISQKEMVLSKDSTALSVTRKGMELAFLAFKEFINNLLHKEIVGRDSIENDFVYKFKNLPLNALLVQNLDTNLISKFLRSFDYGSFDVVQRPHFVYANKCYKIGKYQIKPQAKECLDSQVEFKMELRDNVLTILDNAYQITIHLLESDEMTKKEIIQNINELRAVATTNTTGGGNQSPPS